MQRWRICLVYEIPGSNPDTPKQANMVAVEEGSRTVGVKVSGNMAETSSFLLGISTQLDESDRQLEKPGGGVPLSGDHSVLFHSTS